ncbi:hypothetical protein IGI04_019970 [Brassica rapa subsp. trilocularis]|uniref:Peptidase C1A papain C-terminal domain-containing protein n=1 Tax=Brassica rapa subsp. trilocularis TaxID=1813537 RepID=A0ABQ7MJU3_BRACM|nr:hypothetical protein IGI04_035924 [Brassica rapa subsp. trilocularis]KAG5398156.1 hypothetical protein IGI04_019970 [Brassica rapa subsp. trilocularis]
MESVAGRVSLSTRSTDGLKDRYGSGSCWTCVSLKIGQGMGWIEGLHKEQWIGSLICQTAALNSFSQLKDLGSLEPLMARWCLQALSRPTPGSIVA